MFFADSTTNIGVMTQTFINVPTTLAMNTLTLNGKGAFVRGVVHHCNHWLECVDLDDRRRHDIHCQSEC